MGTPVLIIGESGTGKTYSLRNLDPKQTGVISVIRKPFPFKAKLPQVYTDNYSVVTQALVKAKAKTIVIDDVHYLMANEFMRRCKETGFQKFTDIANNFWKLLQTAADLPEDTIIYFLGHVEPDNTGRVKFKTIGKMLDEKITVEGLFSIVLRTVVKDGVYQFSTQNDGSDTCKSPPGMFNGLYIENDLAMVDKAIRSFMGTGEGWSDESVV